MASGLSAVSTTRSGTVKLQLTDCGETRGRWVIEGDLSSYFDTVHHRLLMKAVRRRISDARFMTLLWKPSRRDISMSVSFGGTSEGVPQGGVISPLLSNIMLNEFDQYLHERYLSGKARKDRWYWNNSIQRGRSTAVRENWQWKPAVAAAAMPMICPHRQRHQSTGGSHQGGVSGCARRQSETQAEHG